MLNQKRITTLPRNGSQKNEFLTDKLRWIHLLFKLFYFFLFVILIMYFYSWYYVILFHCSKLLHLQCRRDVIDLHWRIGHSEARVAI